MVIFMRKTAYPVARPEDVSVSSDAIRQTIRDIRETNQLDLHSFLMLRKGSLIWEEYFHDGEKDRLHVLHSVSKSFTSTAIGIAQAQGLLSLDDKLYDFFPQHKTLCDSDYKREITLRHMLMMGSGFQNEEETLFDKTDLVEAALSQPVVHKPGTVFDYYTLGSHLISAAFQTVYPAGLHAYLRDKLFAPMGFGESKWNIDDKGIVMGGFGLYLTACDLTRLGQLYLQEGMWQGQQLLTKAYVQEATSKQISNDNHPSGNVDWMAGYGYQFWRNSFGGFRADGMHGQYIIVLPGKQAVVVMTSYLENMQIPLTAVANHLLPAIG